MEAGDEPDGLAGYRRRVAALSDTASDLAGLRDADAVLRLITRRVRIALGVDVCVLRLDEDRTALPVVSGTVSAQFYSGRHNTLEAALRAESMASVVDTPLSLAGAGIGVLLVATREERDFTEDDTALLSAFAAQATVAVDMSRLLDETRLALVDLNRANITIQGHAHATSRAEQRQAVERVSFLLALRMMARQGESAAADATRAEFLADVLSEPDQEAALVARGRALGVDLTGPHVVLVAIARGLSRRRLLAAARPHGVLATVYVDHVVVVTRECDPGDAAARTAEALNSTVDKVVTVGGAGPASGVADIASAHALARRCAKSLVALGRAGDGGSVAELGFIGLLLGERTGVEDYVHTVLGPVLEYDDRRGTRLLATLDAYFAGGANLTRAKEMLDVHVNTVVQRLDRIGALLGDTWQLPERALEIQLALRLHRLGP